MSLLTAADTAYMQATQLEAMPGTVVIQRNTHASDGQGGYSDVWAAIGTAIGRIYPKSLAMGREAVTGAQVASLTQWYATLPVGTDVQAKDKLFYDSRTWEITTTNNSEMNKTAVRCEIESLNQEQRN